MRTQLDYIKRATGHLLTQCPWKCLYDPVVFEVCKLYDIASTGQGVHQASVYELDPPNIVWEGLVAYREAMRRVKRFDAQEEERKSKQPKVGKGVMRG